MAKKTSFWTYLRQLGPNSSCQIFLQNWYLEIVQNYHSMQLKRKLENQTWQNLILGPNSWFPTGVENMGVPQNLMAWVNTEGRGGLKQCC